jgi:Xaa-Pro aminopeptidase
MTTLVQEKVQQAVQILRELKIDTWLTFVRETSAGGDPILPLIYGQDLTWNSALIIHASGETVAIVGRYEAEAAHRTGAYSRVISYDQSIQPELIKILTQLDPNQIAINHSVNDVHADGLTHGMYQILIRYLSGSYLQDRLVSAEGLIAKVRGRKTPNEVQLIRDAVETTRRIYEDTFAFMKIGMTEKQVSEFMHSKLQVYDVGAAWEYDHCPAVNTGPESNVGHAAPTNLRIEPGHLVHFDFGVKQKDYCSDIQRVVYFLRPQETHPPAPVQHGFETVVTAIQHTVATIRPGMRGKDIDAVARGVVTGAGYPEYLYATGHHLGRTAHDGAGILGPLWERYGDTPNYLIEPGHVYTIEPGVAIPGFGYIGLEEDILVTEEGATFLGDPQTEIITH